MPLSDPLAILLAHDRWATTQVLSACGPLAPAAFHRRFEIGPGSLHDTLTHIVGVVRTLTETLAGAAPRRRLESDGRQRTPAELQALLDEAWPALEHEAARRPLDEMTSRRTKTGRLLEMTRGALLMHLATHNTHHRAQCLNMLRHLGITPLPPVSVAEWTWAGEGQ